MLQKIKEKVNRLREINKQKYLVNKMTMVLNHVAAAGKILIGLFSLSIFFIINGFYSLAVGSAKIVFLRGRKDAGEDNISERKYYFAMAVILAVASICYIVYMIRLFFIPSNASYSEIIGITAAAIAFFEHITAIIGIVKSNREKDLLKNGMKCVNLASAFTAISFAQVALISMNSQADMSVYYAFGGVFFGVCCSFVSIYMFIKYIIVGGKENLSDEKSE